MAQPSRICPPKARQAEEQLQVAEQERQHARDTTIPCITIRPGNVPDHGTERSSTFTSFESLLFERMAGVNPVNNRDAGSSRTRSVQYAEPEVNAAIEAVSLEIVSVETAIARMYHGELPRHFTVSNPAIPHLIKFGSTLVSLENATSEQIAGLLYRIISGCLKFPGHKDPDQNLTYECVAHLLSLGIDINATGNDRSSTPSPLPIAVNMNSLPLVCLLLEHGVRPDGSFRMFYDGKATNIDIVRELLKAGADPWLSLGQPEQLPTDCKNVSIAEFYRQTGMDINAEASGIGSSTDKLSALELAYRRSDFEVAIQLLDAGAYVKDMSEMNYRFADMEYHDPGVEPTLNVIASKSKQRTYLPCGFKPYTLLHDTLQLGSPVVTHANPSSATAMSSSTHMSASGSALAQAALKPACNALIDGLYSAAAVVRLIRSLHKMPPAFAQALVQALSLARVLGHYGAGQTTRASDLDQGICVALAGADLWEKYLDCKAQFDTLQSNIDRYQASGFTLLTTAAWNGKIRMIKILVLLGARVNYPDRHGSYPLTAAARARKPDTCLALLSLGANAGTSDLQRRSTLFHVADWLTHTDISDMVAVERIAGLIEQLLGLGYDLRQPTPEDYAGHAAYPSVADLLCKPENCVKLALLGQERTGTLVRAILSNIDRRGSLPFLN